jgi:hypothetical protein
MADQVSLGEAAGPRVGKGGVVKEGAVLERRSRTSAGFIKDLPGPRPNLAGCSGGVCAQSEAQQTGCEISFHHFLQLALLFQRTNQIFDGAPAKTELRRRSIDLRTSASKPHHLGKLQASELRSTATADGTSKSPYATIKLAWLWTNYFQSYTFAYPSLLVCESMKFLITILSFRIHKISDIDMV